MPGAEADMEELTEVVAGETTVLLPTMLLDADELDEPVTGMAMLLLAEIEGEP